MIPGGDFNPGCACPGDHRRCPALPPGRSLRAMMRHAARIPGRSLRSGMVLVLSQPQYLARFGAARHGAFVFLAKRDDTAHQRSI